MYANSKFGRTVAKLMSLLVKTCISLYPSDRLRGKYDRSQMQK